MLVAHLAWDTFFSVCAVCFWLSIPADIDNERVTERDAPVLFIFATTVMVPWTILKAVLCTQIKAKSALRLKSLYFKICVGQFIFNDSLFILEVAYFKTYLLGIGMANESVFVSVVSCFMQVYIFILSIWSTLELISFFTYWWRYGGEGLMEPREILVD